MEERRSWLPAGLESSGWQPDDRASQRGPSAGANPWQPYDPDRPESKRTQKSSDAQPAETQQPQPQRSEEQARQRSEQQTQQQQPAAKAEQRDEPTQERRDDEQRGVDDPRSGRSEVDAMGQEKHRTVIGQRYGASRTKQAVYYGAFLAFVVAAYFGLGIAVNKLDKAPAHDKAAAPWAQKGAPNEPLGGFEPKATGQKGPTHFQ